MYQAGFRIDAPIGNNAFSYAERKKLWSQAKIFVTSQKYWNIDDLKIGSHIAFEEIDHNWALQSMYGLQNFIVSTRNSIPIIFFDNHNHALRYRYQLRKKSNHTPLSVIHIDQHTDMNIIDFPLPKAKPPTDTEIFHLTNFISNVWNFIPIAQKLNIVDTVTQITTETKLTHTANSFIPTWWPIVLDIDLDFWAQQMSISSLSKTFSQTKQLCTHASLITVATSPFFLDQSLAIHLAQNIFSN